MFLTLSASLNVVHHVLTVTLCPLCPLSRLFHFLSFGRKCFEQNQALCLIPERYHFVEGEKDSNVPGITEMEPLSPCNLIIKVTLGCFLR